MKRSPKIVFPAPEGPRMSVASPELIPPFISRSRPGIPLSIRPVTFAAWPASRVSMRG